MVLSISFWPALAVDVIFLAVWSVAVGLWAAALPAEKVGTDGWLTRLRPWEHQGKVYARLGLRRWKGWLPDAGTFGGGRSKRLTRPRDPAQWRLMAAETRRAERVHWLVPLAFPVQVAIHDGVVLVPMAAYALIANLPCIAAQRYNRGRLEALGQRHSRRP